MTFAMTSDVGDAHPIEPQNEQLTSANDAHRYVGDHCLTDGPVGTVGLEVEAHCFDLTDPMRRPGWDEINAIISDNPCLLYTSPSPRDRTRSRMPSSA